MALGCLKPSQSQTCKGVAQRSVRHIYVDEHDELPFAEDHASFDGMFRAAKLFLNPLSPAMNASSMCGINVIASTASP